MIPEQSTLQKRFERFNVAEINKISIRDFLEEQGFEKKNRSAIYGMYIATWRGDSDPSLRVDYAQNRWYDFGTKKGGTIIDLVKEMYQIDFVQACKKLYRCYVPNIELQIKSTAEKSPKIQILREKPVSHIALKKYLAKRGIDSKIATMYLKEIEFTTESNTKTYFGLGFKNDSGGYEIRNEFFKGCAGKDITTIDRLLSNCNVFEGFFDFLSYEVLSRGFPQQYPPANTLVLNGVTLVGKNNVKEFLKKHKTINCYFDNNKAGKQAFVNLENELGTQCEVKDCSSLYAQYEDLNKFLENNHKVSQGQRL